MRRLGLTVVVPVALGVGCSLTDLDGFTSDVSPGDAGAEAAAPDAPTSTADGGVDAGAGALFGCSRFTDASFCVDFEGADSLGDSVWSGSDIGKNEGSMALTTEAFVSPGHAVRIEQRDLVGDCNFYVLWRRFTGLHSSMRIRTAVKLGRPSTFSAMDAVGQPGRFYTLLFNADRFEIGVVVQKRENDVVSDLGYTALQVDRAVIGRFVEPELTIAGSPPVLRMQLGAAMRDIPLPTDFAIQSPMVYFGGWCVAEPADYTYDDIAIWVSPP